MEFMTLYTPYICEIFTYIYVFIYNIYIRDKEKLRYNIYENKISLRFVVTMNSFFLFSLLDSRQVTCGSSCFLTLPFFFFSPSP